MAEEMYTKEGFVTIPIDKYDDLVSIATDLGSFIMLALKTARLEYRNSEELSFNDEFIKAFVKNVNEEEYYKRVAELKSRDE